MSESDAVAAVNSVLAKNGVYSLSPENRRAVAEEILAALPGAAASGREDGGGPTAGEVHAAWAHLNSMDGQGLVWTHEMVRDLLRVARSAPRPGGQAAADVDRIAREIAAHEGRRDWYDGVGVYASDSFDGYRQMCRETAVRVLSFAGAAPAEPRTGTGRDRETWWGTGASEPSDIIALDKIVSWSYPWVATMDDEGRRDALERIHREAVGLRARLRAAERGAASGETGASHE